MVISPQAARAASGRSRRASQQLLDRDGGLFGTAAAQVITQRIDERWAALRNQDEPLGLTDAGISLDGAQRQAEAAGAFQQPDALVEQSVDLLPALACGGGPHPVLGGGPQK